MNANQLLITWCWCVYGMMVATTACAAPTAVEYYDPDVDNFFITADPAEQAFVDGGAVGRWQRTGNTFATGGPNQVCRFYGNTNINPATGTIFGPNSHFYAANPNECAGLRAQYTPTAKSWKFESNDFQTTLPVNGACPNGLEPVYRAYNNGFVKGIDSNHRITSNLTAIQQVVACGWINEGVVMCAPSGTASGGTTSCGSSLPSPTVFVSINESTNWPINPGLVGFNFTTAYSAVSYLDPNFQRIAAALAPGWLRYVGGTSSLAFNWNTGLMQDSWVNQFLNYGDASALQNADYMLKGKLGGAANNRYLATDGSILGWSPINTGTVSTVTVGSGLTGGEVCHRMHGRKLCYR